MKKIRLSKTNRINFATFGAVILAYAVFQFMSGAGMLSSTIRGQLVPICAYVTMAYADIQVFHNGLDDLAEGQGNDGQVVAVEPQHRDAYQGPRGSGGQSGDDHGRRQTERIGINGQRRRGHRPGEGSHAHEARVSQAQLAQHLAIVTLAFGQIIKSIMENLYIGIDARGLHFSFLENRIIFRDGAPTLMKPACPRLSSPSTPTVRFRLSAMVT